MRLSRRSLAALASALLLVTTPALAKDMTPLTGTWTLVAADLIKPDGTRMHDYGDNPKGQLIIDTHGHYSVQIYASERPRFASNDKATGTPEEFKAAVLGSSVHFGTIKIDEAAHVLTLHLEHSIYPNQEGTQQERVYELNGDELSYRIQPRPDGSIPISVWRRVR